jgi:type II secretory pathway pseudopilin PulG
MQMGISMMELAIVMIVVATTTTTIAPSISISTINDQHQRNYNDFI